jgi:hypothetical protein
MQLCTQENRLSGMKRGGFQKAGVETQWFSFFTERMPFRIMRDVLTLLETLFSARGFSIIPAG